MSHNYYYFVASLPHISYGDKPTFSTADFRDQCEIQLNSGDASLIPYCTFDPKIIMETSRKTGSSFIDQFMQWERTMILTLASLRAVRLKRQFTDDVPHDMPRVEALAKAAFEMDDPLEAQLTMDRARWGVLDEMLGLEYFGVNNIYVYLLKLQLLERKQRLDTEKGLEAYREIYNSILNNYKSRA